jgi:hypothetical protein
MTEPLKQALDRIAQAPQPDPVIFMSPHTWADHLAACQKGDTPAWVKCGECDNFLCTIHGGHADSCACPELEFWDSELGLNPYEQGGRLTVAELEALKVQHGYVEE